MVFGFCEPFNSQNSQNRHTTKPFLRLVYVATSNGTIFGTILNSIVLTAEPCRVVELSLYRGGTPISCGVRYGPACRPLLYFWPCHLLRLGWDERRNILVGTFHWYMATAAAANSADDNFSRAFDSVGDKIGSKGCQNLFDWEKNRWCFFESFP